MPDQREIWSAVDGQYALASHAANTVVMPLDHKIKFYRQEPFYPPPPEEEEEGEETQEISPVETAVISAIDKKVVGYIHGHGGSIDPVYLISVQVDDPELPTAEIKIEAASGEITLPLTQNGEGSWQAEKLLLFVYGDDGDLNGATFEGVELIDISESDDIGFKTAVPFTASDHRRSLGIIDFLIKEDDDAGGEFKTCRFGLFKTRTPTFKLVAEHMDPARLEIILDDGDDETEDGVDITRLVDHTAGQTDYEEFPIACDETSTQVAGSWDAEADRSRVYTEEAPEEGNLALFIYGENRVKIRDKETGEYLFAGHFLLFLQDEETVVGSTTQTVEVAVEEIQYSVLDNHLIVKFVDDTSKYDMSRWLFGAAMRPQGFVPDVFLVQVSPREAVPAEELSQLVETLRGYEDSVVERIGFDQVVEPEVPLMERYARAFTPTTGANVEFDPAQGTFAHAEPCFFHHFYIHTFPAHRLIDKVRFPDELPPTVSLSGAHFEFDKTFVLPSSRDEIQRILQLRRDNPDRKFALFGHTDAVGTDDYNNELSLKRGGTVFALLVKRPEPWLQRFYRAQVRGERAWGTREYQHMMSVLGYYDLRVDGIWGGGTQRGVHGFEDDNGLRRSPPGTVRTDTRERMVQSYFDNLVPEALAVNDFFQDNFQNPAVFGCGEAFPVVETDQANPQNRRVTFVLRRTAVTPVDTSKRGNQVPYNDWLSQESEVDADGADPPFVVGVYDSGFGNGAAYDYSGERLDDRNAMLTKGRRIVRPTDVSRPVAAVIVQGYADGNISQITDANRPHGTGVMTSMTSDGIGAEVGGNLRTADQVVLGTGKDVKIRPIRFSGGVPGLFRIYETLAADDEVKVVSSSIGFRDVQDFPGDATSSWSDAERTQLARRVRQMVDRGAIYFRAACNVNPRNEPLRRAVFRTQAGFVAPDRTQKRSDHTGDDAYKQKVAGVGAIAHITNAGDPEIPSTFTFLGNQVNIAMPGTDIRMMYVVQNVPPPGSTLTIRNVNGTSFSTPMTAGVAAELMLANRDLQQNGNLVQVMEILEATADPIPSLGALPANDARRGLYTPGGNVPQPNMPAGSPGAANNGSTNPDPRLNNADLADFRRVNFWKAVLAAVNGGIPTEAQYNGADATDWFDSLTAIDHDHTEWYGFEIRVQVPRASVWFKRTDNTYVRIEDTGAAMPGNRTVLNAWRKSQPLRAPGDHATVGFRGFALPAFPFAGTNWWMSQFSIKRADLTAYTELIVMDERDTPQGAGTEVMPRVCTIDLSDYGQLRDPSSIPSPGDAAQEQLRAHLEEFSHFVFHVSAKPQALSGFRLVHPDGANAAEEITVHLFAVDRFGNIKTDYGNNVNVTHTGTPGATGPDAGVFIDGNPATAAVAVAMTRGRGSFRLLNHTVEDFELRAAADGQNGSSQLSVAAPGPLSDVSITIAHWTADADGETDPTVRPVGVGDRLRVTVTALDDNERTQTNYTGAAELRILEGEMGWDSGDGTRRAGGVHVADSNADPFDESRFTHQFRNDENGRHDFSVFVYSNGPLVLEVVIPEDRAAGRDTLRSQTNRIEIQGGALHHFTLDHPDTVTAGNTFHLAVTARDEQDNVIENFSERVNLTRVSGTAAAGGDASAAQGVHFGPRAGARQTEHDHYVYQSTDRGVHNFEITPFTAETIKIGVRSAGGVPNPAAETGDITVQGPGAIAAFEFDMRPSALAGERYRVTVRAVDGDGKRVPNFTGAVNLTLMPTCTAFNAAGPSGTQIHNSPHAFVADDNGEFEFEATSHTAEQVQFRAQVPAAGVSTRSPQMRIAAQLV
jgi:peptidoglycan hydrolase-like protein with peptidoglycan-binding domain